MCRAGCATWRKLPPALKQRGVRAVGMDSPDQDLGTQVSQVSSALTTSAKKHCQVCQILILKSGP